MNRSAKSILAKKQAFKNEIESAFGAEKCESIWLNAESLFDEILVRFSDLAKGERMHTDNFIFPAAAIYLAIKEFDAKKAFLILEKVMKEKALQANAGISKMLKFLGGKTFFIRMWNTISKKKFRRDGGEKCDFYLRKA